MKPELDRLKSDLDTMQKALGLAPSIGREWLQWMKRDKWMGLWWSLPGLIVLTTALWPHDRVNRYWGLILDQWAGFMVAAALLVIAAVMSRKVTASDGRPDGLIREMRRINGMNAQGWWFN